MISLHGSIRRSWYGVAQCNRNGKTIRVVKQVEHEQIGPRVPFLYLLYCRRASMMWLRAIYSKETVA